MKRRRFTTLFRVSIGFIFMFSILLLERMGIRYGVSDPDLAILPYDQIMYVKETGTEKSCLILFDSTVPTSNNAKILYCDIFTDLRVPFKCLDIYEEGVAGLYSKLKNYETLVVAMSELSTLGEELLEIPRWVGEGGRCLFGIPPYKSASFDLICGKLGIISCDYAYGLLDTFCSDPDFMLGAQRTYTFMDAYEAAMQVVLDNESRVYAKTIEEELPIIWSRDYKNGRFVVCNFGYVAKAYRGVFSSAYSLLDDIFIYPVINSATYYLDDFPSPVPNGNGEYIQRDYGMGIADFYASVWWPDVLKLGEKHDIKYTGLIIETYGDQTEGELPSNNSTADYYYYGNMLLNRGGELGYHGYNHEPLCGPDFVYNKNLGYKTWESNDEMYKAFEELTRFSKSLFPSADLCVYVPPSDVLSAEGREMLGSDFPDIRAIASIYLEGSDEYYQEFSVAEDGMIETPRTISGGTIDDYAMFAAFSEMNLHFVSSHFMHPDDLLDEDRGAESGWESYRQCLDDYMSWVDESSYGNIRHLNGSGIAGAVQRYVNVIPQYTYDYSSVTLQMKGFIDTAYFIVRVNDGILGACYGGEITKLNETMYLVKAKSPKLTLIRR